MLRYMLDTNIVIYAIKNKPENIRERLNALKGQTCISSVSLMELLYGAAKSRQREQNLNIVEGFASRLDVLDFDSMAASHAGEIKADLVAKGNVIGPYDLQIAGHCRSRGLCLVSNNRSEFKRVGGLRLENWVKG